MKELDITFSELKVMTNRMLCLVKRTVGNNEKLSLRKAFYQDLGVTDSDWDSFLEEYEKEFNCQLEGLNYDDYFEDRPTWKDFLLFPLRILTLPLFLLPERQAKHIKKTLYPFNESKHRLTIGDLVLSAIAKKFVKREQTQIKIKYNR